MAYKQYESAELELLVRLELSIYHSKTIILEMSEYYLDSIDVIQK